MSHNVEDLKHGSRRLRGTLADDLRDGSGAFQDDNATLLKFHGIYQQQDRDRRKTGDKEHSFMVRSKIPGGELTAAQYLTHDSLADAVGNGTLRITTRQGLQFHGVWKGDLPALLQTLHASGVTSWGACGDVVRNVAAAPIPLDTPVHRAVQELAREISRRTEPESGAYAEIWIDGAVIDSGEPAPFVEQEPLYGAAYLPRKFKIGIAIPPRNDVDALSQDLGFIAHEKHGILEGYTLVVGGGMGMTHGKIETFPVLAKPLFFVTPEHAADAALAVVAVQRDFGNRENRKQARLKYLIEKRGIAWFRREVEQRVHFPTSDPRPFSLETVADPLGLQRQGDGCFFLGLHVATGRIQDTPAVRVRTALREIATTFQPVFRFTPNQNVILKDLPAADVPRVIGILRRHGVALPAELTTARQMGIACVALPTCGLALAESERVFNGLMDEIDGVLRRLGLARESILFRMTGCPNGCARPYNADFAFVGRGPDQYAVFVGGSAAGTRLARLEIRAAALRELPGIVERYLTEYTKLRRIDEGFSAYWNRARQPDAVPDPRQFHFADVPVLARGGMMDG